MESTESHALPDQPARGLEHDEEIAEEQRVGTRATAS
jgi:hypothetical protein